uniref:3'-5' exonuclease domain-containing protein n=1 Tax=Ditylenchus dipsaci TaxID=166011 RepID=A0A915DX15_9BILA
MSSEVCSSRSKDENGIAFKKCVSRVKEIFEKELNEMDDATKHNIIGQSLRTYFAEEELLDVFEGFLHLLNQFHTLASDAAQRSSTKLAVQVLQLFDEFINQCDPTDQDAILEQMPSNRDIYIDALKVVAHFRVKFIKSIAFVFRLPGDEERKQKLLIPLIKTILRRNDIEIAVNWIVFFNIRDAFPFDEVVCHLLLCNKNDLMEAFIGEDIYRRKRLVVFLDKLVGMELKRFRGYTELEELVLQDIKKLEKNAVKYMKVFDIPDSFAPNVLDLRSREALLFHHHRFTKRETSEENYEETALQAMEKSAYVRRFYLDFLCMKGNQRQALYFAVALGDTLETFPKFLRDFCERCPSELELTKKDVQKARENKARQHEIESHEKCELFENFPIYVIEDWTACELAMEKLSKEAVIGIDTEWKPHFCSTKEQVALIQVSSSTAVYLFDVVVLENRLSNEQWVQFFKMLLCSEHSTKIGYDFSNDLRVLKSSFPFLSQLLPETKHILCLYKLLSASLVEPNICRALFGSENFSINLSLYEVAKLLLDIELDKSERVGNWIQRPLRLEQKRYASLDAYALIGCFKIIARRLNAMDDEKACQHLQKISLVDFAEVKSPVALDPETGERVFASKKSKESDQEFIESILSISSEISATVTNPGELHTSDDYMFVMDSMLFGLGQRMRKCGFSTHMIADREKLIKYCEEHPNALAVSAGKGFKQIQMRLPDRAVQVPINTQDVRLNSQLVGYLMRQLKIVVDPASLSSRCVKCNAKSFVRLPVLVVKALFYIHVIRHEMDWIAVSKDDATDALRELRQNAVNHKSAPFNGELQDDDYTAEICDDQIVCECNGCRIDIMSKLIDAGFEGPIDIRMGGLHKKEIFEKRMSNFSCALVVESYRIIASR